VKHQVKQDEYKQLALNIK